MPAPSPYTTQFLARPNARTPTWHACHLCVIVSVWESRDTYPSKTLSQAVAQVNPTVQNTAEIASRLSSALSL